MKCNVHSGGTVKTLNVLEQKVVMTEIEAWQLKLYVPKSKCNKEKWEAYKKAKREGMARYRAKKKEASLQASVPSRRGRSFWNILHGHAGSVEESRILLDVPPDRIGHGTYLHPEVGGDQSLVNSVVRSKIPIEMCMTSNLIGGVVETPSSHHLQYWRNKNHPCVICTDDKGVFSTSLSEEYLLAANTFNLSHLDIWDMSQKAIECIFGGEDLKRLLRTTWSKEKDKIGFIQTGTLNGSCP
nr:adenosine deaminase-like protein [Lytechinus pictus]